jgi:hypothetical protein
MAVGDPVNPSGVWLSDRALQKLRRSIERLASASDLLFDDYVPDDYVESGISESTLSNFRSAMPPSVTEAYEGETDQWSASYEVVAQLDGQGDAHWHATQLSPLELELFGSRVEAPDAGGILHDVDVACPCSITVTAGFMVQGAMWTDVEIDRIWLDAEEAEHRRSRHEREELDRLQDLGLLPPEPDQG